jgi:hypothetical protein
MTVSETAEHGDNAKCTRVRERVCAAIERGRRTAAPIPLTGDRLSSGAIETAIDNRLYTPREPERVMSIAGSVSLFVGFLVVTVQAAPELWDGIFTRKKETPPGSIESILAPAQYEVLYPNVIIAVIVTLAVSAYLAVRASTTRPSVVVAGLPRALTSLTRPLGNSVVSAVLGLAVTLVAVKLGITKS